MKSAANPSNIRQRLAALETAVIYNRLPDDGQFPFAHTPGSLPLLLSAPHGTAHRRNGTIKGEEEYTSALARLLAAETGAHALYAQFFSHSDPNHDQNAPYKTFLGELIRRHQIRFVLDIHGMSDRYKIGLALGTINGRSCPDHEPVIIHTLEKHGFRQTTRARAGRFERLRWDHFVVNHPRFTGGVRNHTVTRFVSEDMGVPAAQVELCASARVVRQGINGQKPSGKNGEGRGVETAVRALIALVRRLAASPAGRTQGMQ